MCGIQTPLTYSKQTFTFYVCLRLSSGYPDIRTSYKSKALLDLTEVPASCKEIHVLVVPPCRRHIMLSLQNAIPGAEMLCLWKRSRVFGVDSSHYSCTMVEHKSRIIFQESNMEWLEEGRANTGNPLQYSCLEYPKDRGAWRAPVHRITKSWTWMKWLNTV